MLCKRCGGLMVLNPYEYLFGINGPLSIEI